MHSKVQSLALLDCEACVIKCDFKGFEHFLWNSVPKSRQCWNNLAYLQQDLSKSRGCGLLLLPSHSPNSSHVYYRKVQRRLINCWCITLTTANMSCPLNSGNLDWHGGGQRQTDKQLCFILKAFFYGSPYTVIIFQIIMCCKVYWPLVNLYLPSWNS